MLIDARGLECPKPVMMAQEALSGMQEGTVEVLVDNYSSSENVLMFAQRAGFQAEVSREGQDYRVKIEKGSARPTANAQPEKEAKVVDAGKDIFMVVATDQLGKEEELGRKLVKGFFETMKVTGEIPRTMFFLNAGVKLTTTDEEVIPVLKEIEQMGAMIFSCGTCLKYYGLESGLKVGYRGGTSNIVEEMTERGKTIWIG